MTDDRRIALLVHTRDSDHELPRLLDSTAWCDERVIIDMSSNDTTATIAKDAGCRVITIDPEPFRDELRNRHLGDVHCGWTLVLDSDEYLSADAESAIRGLIDAATDDIVGYALPRSNRIAGQVLRGPIWYPDHQVRLFRSGSIRYLEGHHRRPVPVDTEMAIVDVDPDRGVHIHHDNYDSVAELIRRQVTYAVTDHHDTDPSTFDLDEYLIEGQRQFDTRCAPEVDGSLSYALAVVMYWNEVIRGLLRWEAAGRVAPLPTTRPGPVLRHASAANDLDVDLRRRIVELEEESTSYRHQVEALRRSRSMRYTAPARWVASMLRDRSR